MERAARIAVKEVKDFLDRNATVEQVTLVCFDKYAHDLFAGAVKEAAG